MPYQGTVRIAEGQSGPFVSDVYPAITGRHKVFYICSSASGGELQIQCSATPEFSEYATVSTVGIFDSTQRIPLNEADPYVRIVLDDDAVDTTVDMTIFDD